MPKWQLALESDGVGEEMARKLRCGLHHLDQNYHNSHLHNHNQILHLFVALPSNQIDLNFLRLYCCRISCWKRRQNQWWPCNCHLDHHR